MSPSFLGWMKIICFIVYLIFVGYCLQLFYKQKEQLYAVRRRPKLTIILVIMCIPPTITATFIESPTCTFTFCANIPDYYTQISGMIPYAFVMILVTTRVWFIFYDLNYCQRILDHKWWETVNKTEYDKDFFVKNKHKYGTLKPSGYTFKILISFTSIWILQLLIVDKISHDIAVLNYLTICLLLWLMQLYCFCKMGKHYDVYSIRKEITRLALWYLISAMYFGTAYSVFLDHPIIKWITVFATYVNSAIYVAICTIAPYIDNQRMQEAMKKEANNNSETDKVNYTSWQQYGLLSNFILLPSNHIQSIIYVD